MKTVISNIGKIFMRSGKADTTISSTAKKHLKLIENYKTTIRSNGYKSTKVCYLVRDFGYKKRSDRNVVEINSVIEESGLHCFPALKLETSWKTNIKLFEFPVKQEGDLFTKELELQKYLFEQNAFTAIGVPSVKREISPKRTSDKLDFYASFENEHVVIEVKKKDGGKSAVEQLWRYAGFLKHEYPEQPIRKILVTGVSDFWTAYAIHGMVQKGRGEIEWYIYNWNKKNDSISLVPMKYENYSQYFRAH